MLRRYGRGITIIVLALILGLMWVGPTAAQAPQGTGPDDTMVPTGQWTKIEQGQYHWYAFHFDYDEDRVADPIEIRMYAEPYEIATLTVRDEAQANAWRADGTQEHFGCCTMVDIDKDEDGNPDYAVWAGSLRSSGTYYIVVEHARNTDVSGMYRFTIAGEGLTFPTKAPAPVADTTATTAAAAPAPRMIAEDGSGPDLAMVPTGEWTVIEEGQYQWYTFYYDYDEDYKTEAVEIRMYTDIYDGATLTVRNTEQAQLWRDEGKQEHFGCCTMVDIDKDEDGKADYALWAGTLRSSGQYYIVVEHARNVSGPVAYRFTMSGRGFSFPTAAPVAEPVAPPAAEAPAEAPVVEAPKPVVLAGLNGTGPDYALAPTTEATVINDGQYHWYAFQFDYDDENPMDPVEIRFYSGPLEGATLTVRNAVQAEQWRKEGEHEHFGCCTLVDIDKDEDGNADYAMWSGNLRESGTYYIVVEHARNMSGPVVYHFALTGEGISY